MSISYSYANHDKRQFFTCGLFGCARFRTIGTGHSARAFTILLSERGTWSKDRVSVVSDVNTEFSDLQWNGLDIVVEVILMLIEIDGFDWIAAAMDNDSTAFTYMCNFAFHLRDTGAIKTLDQKFGSGKWQRQYENLVKHNTDLSIQQVLTARDRGLKILA